MVRIIKKLIEIRPKKTALLFVYVDFRNIRIYEELIEIIIIYLESKKRLVNQSIRAALSNPC